MENQEQGTSHSEQGDAQNTHGKGPKMHPDYSEHRVIAVIGYLFPIIFFLPLAGEVGPKNSYAMFHANQHLNLLLFAVALTVFGLIPVIGWVLAPIGWIAYIVFAIIGVINAANDKEKELPLIGKYRLLK